MGACGRVRKSAGRARRGSRARDAAASQAHGGAAAAGCAQGWLGSIVPQRAGPAATPATPSTRRHWGPPCLRPRSWGAPGGRRAALTKQQQLSAAAAEGSSFSSNLKSCACAHALFLYNRGPLMEWNGPNRRGALFWASASFPRVSNPPLIWCPSRSFDLPGLITEARTFNSAIIDAIATVRFPLPLSEPWALAHGGLHRTRGGDRGIVCPAAR